jgi:hypothetical protein
MFFLLYFFLDKKVTKNQENFNPTAHGYTASPNFRAGVRVVEMVCAFVGNGLF